MLCCVFQVRLANITTVFAQMLNEMRLGKISEQTVSSFRGLARRLEFNDGLEVTEL